MAKSESRGGKYDIARQKELEKNKPRGTKTKIGDGVKSPIPGVHDAVGMTPPPGMAVKDPNAFIGSLVAPRPAGMVGSAGGDTLEASTSVGDLMNPTMNAPEAPTSDPNEFNARVHRNSQFLQSPEARMQLQQFAQVLMGGGDIGDAMSAWSNTRRDIQKAQAKAHQQTFENQVNLEQLDISRGNLDVARAQADIARRSQAFEEAQWTAGGRKRDLEEANSAADLIKKQKDLVEADRIQKVRDAAAGDASAANDVEGMSTGELLRTAGTLALAGDSTTANTLIAAANAKSGMNVTTNDITEYERAGGIIGGEHIDLGTWLFRAKQALGGASTGLDTPLLEQAIKKTNQADDLEPQLRDLSFMKTLLDTTDTGWSVPYTAPIKAALMDLGIEIGPEDEEQVVNQQLFDKHSKQLALWMRNPESGFGLTGNTSNFDIGFLMATVPQLATTDYANRAILISMVAQQKFKIQMARAEADYIFEHKTLAGWSEYRDKEVIPNLDLVSADDAVFLQSLVDPEWGTDKGDQGTTPPKGDISDAPPTWLNEYDKQNWHRFDDNDRKLRMNKEMYLQIQNAQ